MTSALPSAEETPTVDVWPTAARAMGISRSAAYEAVRRGDLPTIRVGRRILVPTAALRRLLELDPVEQS
jgi:excisionase family DNA binding protein